MKITARYLIICFLLVFSYCSKSEDDQPVNYYNIASCNGVDVITQSDYRNRFGDFVSIDIKSYFEGSNWVLDTGISLEFSLDGHFGQITVMRETTEYKNFVYDSASNFNFELVEYNVENNTVKGNYSGKVYLDPKDLNSNFVTVQGSFFFPLPEPVGSMATEAKLKMNGEDWRSTVLMDPFDYTYEGLHVGWADQFLSDDKYKIVIGHVGGIGTSAIGSYSFDNNSTDFFVKLGKFNPVTNQINYYVTQGIFTITTAGYLPPDGAGYYYTGNFNFTATNPIAPFDVINVTEGIVYYHD